MCSELHGNVQTSAEMIEGHLVVTLSRLSDALTDCNTDYLFLVEHPQARWTQDDDKVPINQDAVVVPIYWMGQLVCSNRKLQGRLLDAS